MASNYLLYSPLTGTEYGIPKAANSSSDLITLDGKLGIGTTSPESALHIVGDRNNTPTTKGIHLGKNGNDYAIEICASGNTNASFIDFTIPNNDRRGRMIYTHTDDNFIFYTANNVEGLRIHSDGHLGIGTSKILTESSMLHFKITNDKFYRFGMWDGSNYAGLANICRNTSSTYAGRVEAHYITGWTAMNSPTYNNTSDDRIKYNEEDIANPLALINKLKPKKYEKLITKPEGVTGTWIPTDANWDTVKGDWEWKYETGFIAQNVRDEIPELSFCVEGTETDSSGNQTPLSLNYTNLFVVATAALQEVDRQIQAEKAKVSTLETKVSTLETELAAIKAHLNL